MPALSTNLKSSWLATASYDTDTQTLTVTTRNGRQYVHQTSPDVFQGLASAPSPGNFYNANLRED